MYKALQQIILFLILISFCRSNLYSQSRLSNPSLLMESLFEKGKLGVNVEIAPNDFDIHGEYSDNYKSIELNEYVKLKAQINDVKALKDIKINYLFYKHDGFSSRDSSFGDYMHYTLLNSTSSNQITTNIDWANVGYGIGNIFNITGKSQTFAGICPGVGLSSIKISDTSFRLSKSSFFGVNPLVYFTFYTGNAIFSAHLTSEYKALIGKNILYLGSHKLEISIHIIRLLGLINEDEYRFRCIPELDLCISGENTQINYSDYSNNVNKFSLGLKYTFQIPSNHSIHDFNDYGTTLTLK